MKIQHILLCVQHTFDQADLKKKIFSQDKRKVSEKSISGFPKINVTKFYSQYGHIRIKFDIDFIIKKH